MLKIHEKTSPEAQVESIMSYTIQATEILKETPTKLQKETYRYMLMANWLHYYTGVLQTMGYLLIDKFFTQSKNLILFHTQQKNNTIELLSKDISYLWKKRKTPTDINQLTQELSFIETQKTPSIKIQDEITNQIKFIRVLNPHHEIARWTIGSSLTLQNFNNFLNHPIIQSYNIIFVGWLHSMKDETECINQDKTLINHLLLWKKMNHYKKDFPHLYYFSEASRYLHNKNWNTTEILAYLNTSQMNDTNINCTGYTCIIT